MYIPDDTVEPISYTFTVTPAAPGKPQTIRVNEHPSVAYNTGLIEAMRTAGGLACVYGTVTVVDQRGKTWTVTVKLEG